ncbi:hypothetical protein JL722_6117 [Aureococcus anophagefferens]|nr:hypothetical protein JL722_6117 [Aureococcus anophagefferens]
MAADAGADTEAVPARKIAPDDDDTGADVEVRSAAGSFWSELGWMGLAAPVLFGLVGAAMAWLGVNAIQLYAYSSAHRSTWEARRVESWGKAGFDVSGVAAGYAAVEWTPRPAYDFEHSDNYKYARLLRLYHHDTWEVLVAAAVYLVLCGWCAKVVMDSTLRWRSFYFPGAAARDAPSPWRRARDRLVLQTLVFEALEVGAQSYQVLRWSSLDPILVALHGRDSRAYHELAAAMAVVGDGGLAVGGLAWLLAVNCALTATLVAVVDVDLAHALVDGLLELGYTFWALGAALAASRRTARIVDDAALPAVLVSSSLADVALSALPVVPFVLHAPGALRDATLAARSAARVAPYAVDDGGAKGARRRRGARRPRAAARAARPSSGSAAAAAYTTAMLATATRRDDGYRAVKRDCEEITFDWEWRGRGLVESAETVAALAASEAGLAYWPPWGNTATLLFELAGGAALDSFVDSECGVVNLASQTLRRRAGDGRTAESAVVTTLWGHHYYCTAPIVSPKFAPKEALLSDGVSDLFKNDRGHFVLDDGYKYELDDGEDASGDFPDELSTRFFNVKRRPAPRDARVDSPTRPRRYLEVRAQSITALPSSLCRSMAPTLESLVVTRTALEALPESCGGLDALEYLDLSYNLLASLPDSIGALSELKVLEARGNRLQTLPESIAGLASLERLELASNDLSALPESIGDLAALATLVLDMNELTSFPDSLGDLASLETLSAIENGLVELPGSFGGLASLETLDLKYNALERLPPSFAELASLRYLDLSANDLAALPADRLASLEIAVLAENRRLDGLPPSMAHLEHLSDVFLVGTELCCNATLRGGLDLAAAEGIASTCSPASTTTRRSTSSSTASSVPHVS